MSNVSTSSSCKNVYTTQATIKGYSFTLADEHDVPVVILNGQCFELKERSQIVLVARTAIASKNGYLGHFRTETGRPSSDFTGSAALSTSRKDAVVSKGMPLPPILRP